MKIEIEIDDSILQDAFDNACETGIAYWVNNDCKFYPQGHQIDIKRNDAYGKEEDPSTWHSLSAKFRMIDFDDGGKEYEVTPAKMGECLGAFLMRHPAFADCYIGEYNGDATSDDMLFQFAAFGEVIFG